MIGQIAGHPNRAEAALADLLAQLEGAYGVAFFFGVGFLELLGPEGVAEEGIGAPGIAQRALDLEVDFRVVTAGVGEEDLALCGFQHAGKGSGKGSGQED
jgi:hypothetical protein